MGKKTLSDAASRAWATLFVAQARVVEQVEAALAAADLPPLDWYDVLWTLEKVSGGRLRMFELADQIVAARYNLTRIADRLVEAGLIAREACPDDRRGAYCVITAEGRALRARMWPVYRGVIERLFEAQLAGGEAEAIGTALARVVRAAREPAVLPTAVRSRRSAAGETRSRAPQPRSAGSSRAK